MAAGDRAQIAEYPGVLAVLSCSYVISHGITPGTALLQILPQPIVPAQFGPLVISDGVGTVLIPNCRLDQIRSEIGPSGQVWTLEIVDRRWRWRDLGDISGSYNQLDPHGKLIPWTIRSPTELAKLCLDAMGEVPSVLDMPPGLDSSVGANLNTFLPNGLNFPPTGTNPPIDWQAEPPAVALQRLCDQYGRRIVYDLATDSIAIVPLGTGNTLPVGNLSIGRLGPGLKSRELPDGVKVIGSAIRYQSRFLLEAVGEEWNGEYLPIDLLSYAPMWDGAVQITVITLSILKEGGELPDISAEIEVTIAGTQTALVKTDREPTDTAEDVLNNLLELINSSAVAPICEATVVDNVVDDDGISEAQLVIRGKAQGVSFGVQTNVQNHGDNQDGISMSSAMTQAPRQAKRTWAYSAPPMFANVIATDRLTQWQARALAQKTVFKCYRIKNLDVRNIGDEAGSYPGPLTIPGFGPIARIQQIHLLDTKVDQITPAPFERNAIDSSGRPVVLNFYNGYSKDQAAVVYGSISRGIVNGQYATYNQDQDRVPNTPFYTKVYARFQVIPDWQMIAFDVPVYRQGDSSDNIWTAVIASTATGIRGVYLITIVYGSSRFTYTSSHLSSGTTAATVLADLASQVNDESTLTDLGFRASASQSSITITAPWYEGFTLSADVQSPTPAGTTFVAARDQGGQRDNLGGASLTPELTLETSCHVRDHVTNAFVRFFLARDFGQNAGTNYAVSHHDDCRLEITSTYDDTNVLQRFSPLDTDPIARGNFYLSAMSLQYMLSDAQTVEYNGIVPIALDGAIQQVTYEIGEGGARTVASRNTEHDYWVPPYPARRRIENIPSLERQGFGNQNTNPLFYRPPGDD